MHIPPVPHRWAVPPRQAILIQKRLAPRVLQTRPRNPVRSVAGVDAAFSTDGRSCIAGVVLWDVRRRAVVEQHIAQRQLRFPYVPGLLSFREAPAVIGALRKLRSQPDAIMCDAHGIAHPRRFGLACHVGVICDAPTIGCAKSRLVGVFREPPRRRGGVTQLRADREILGAVLRTRDSVRPVFVSVGHRVDLETAVATVLECAVQYRIPEPTRRADRLVAAVKRGLHQ